MTAMSKPAGGDGQFTPKFISMLRAGYGAADLRADAVAGLTVAIVALPLSMGIAIASGVSPERGLYAAIVGGFLVSLLGGSRFQIGGPAGAFIVLVAAVVMRHGVEGMLLATFLSGFFMIALGGLRLGAYVKFIPFPVTVGFTAGIAVIIFASQLHDLFGLTLAGPEPGDLVPKLRALLASASTASPPAIAVAGLTIAVVVATRRFKPAWPAMLIAIAVATVVTVAMQLDVETIGTRFGGIPRSLPWPAFPELGWERIQAVLPDAVAFALLGSIESLLSAVVADGMSGDRHRSNGELVAQGIANIGAALFGAMPVTGTIARTATNVRAGAHGPVSGMLHALILLGFIFVAAPLASFIPLAALAGMLAMVAWNMVERHAIATLLRSSRGDAAVVLVTFLLVIFRDLVEGIVVGFALAAMLFIHRMSTAVSVAVATAGESDIAERADDPDTLVYRISGAFFFGAASAVGSVFDRIGDRHRNLVLDFSQVPVIDSSAANVVADAVHRAGRSGVRVFVTGATTAARRHLLTSGVRPPVVRYKGSVESALAQIDLEGSRTDDH